MSHKHADPAALARLLLSHMDNALADLTEAQFAAMIAQSTSRAAGGPKPSLRWQDELIEKMVPLRCSVLDLGCGNGELLLRLTECKQVRGQGVELDPGAVFECVARGVPVFQSDLDAGLKGFSDQSFDYVVLEETLQTLHRPVDVLMEMLRVGRRGIVSFPNFAHWQVRFDLAFRGRMPVTPRLPRRWYDTPNIHLLTIQDFLDWAGENHVRVVEGHALADGAVRPLQPGDNLHAEEALLVVERTA